jgi:hypothetical protein
VIMRKRDGSRHSTVWSKYRPEPADAHHRMVGVV